MIDGWMDGVKDGNMHVWMDRRGWVGREVWTTDEWMDEWMLGWVDCWLMIFGSGGGWEGNYKGPVMGW